MRRRHDARGHERRRLWHSGTGGFSVLSQWSLARKKDDDKPLVDNDLEELLIVYTGEVLTRALRTNVGPQRRKE